jgi:hypothetical protein
MLSDKVVLENDENKIRDVLLIRYLRNDEIRRKINLLEYNFDREVLEDFSVGRTDIRIISHNTFLQQAAYYILECKRIDNVNLKGVTGLNAHYIENGICRFSSGYYSCFYNVNAMLGFIVEEMNISKNIDNINELLQKYPQANTTIKIHLGNYVKDFEFQYQSLHTSVTTAAIKLYHLMFDFSKNVKS